MHMPTVESTKKEFARAYDFAMRLLGFSERTVNEMEERLLEKGFSEEITKKAIAELKRVNLLDDARYAIQYVRSRIRNKPAGRFLIKAKLLEKGIEENIIDSMMVQNYPESLEKEKALELARKKLSEIPEITKRLTENKKGRIGRFLSSRGFEEGLIWEVIGEMDKS